MAIDDGMPLAHGAPKKQLSEAPTVHSTCIVQESTLGAWTSLGPNTTIVESSFGEYSYTADNVSIIYASVGKFCSIASHVRLNPGNHPMWRVTQHHATYRRAEYGFAPADDEQFFAWRREHSVAVGHDVWIGHGAVVMPGVSIGTGAVIGAGAVVTKAVEPYMIVVGVPARPLRMRFPQSVADTLLAIAWWDWPRATLEERFAEFNDLDRFLRTYATEARP